MNLAKMCLLALIVLPVPSQAKGDPFAAARADIGRYCARKGATCISKQKQELGYFVTMMAGFKDPANMNARACMMAGKRGRHVDWVVAASCMRLKVKGRQIGG